MPKLPKTPKTSRKAALAAWLAEHRPSCISETERDQIQLALSPISGRYLHGLLRKCGVTLTPMVDGVRQGTLDELETSLLALLDEYSPGKVARRKQVR